MPWDSPLVAKYKKQYGSGITPLTHLGQNYFEVDRSLIPEMLHRLRDEGNTIVVIEHNLDVIKTADWVIDLGPEGGEGGGEIIATGTPEDIATNERSWTGKYLQPLLLAGTHLLPAASA